MVGEAYFDTKPMFKEIVTYDGPRSCLGDVTVMREGLYSDEYESLRNFKFVGADSPPTIGATG